MVRKLSVNTGQVVINDGSSFLVTSPNGSIDESLPQGLFVRDTRLLSYYEITINRSHLAFIISGNTSHRTALYEFTNPEFGTVNGKLPYGCLTIYVRRDVVGGLHEDITITNRYRKRVEFQLMLSIRSDFADIFQVKSKALLARGDTTTEWKDGALITEYRNGEFHRGIIVKPDGPDSPVRYANGRLVFDVSLNPTEPWHTCINFTALADNETISPRSTCRVEHRTEAGQVLHDFLDEATQFHSSNAHVTQCYEQALEDMGALRIKIQLQDQEFWMPAAGIPWFVAVFGRDSIITSLQTLAVYPRFAGGTVRELARLQATEVDDWRDAQPGKFLHEIRRGELAQLHEIPHTPYYGTVDTTLLWIITVWAAYRWHGDRNLLDESREPLDRALQWIDKYGDFDGDGWVEYLTRSKDGLRNQGWKDSGDSIVYPDGSQVDPPIALCEVQGYLYAAYRSAAKIFDTWGEKERAAEFRRRADELYKRFNEVFWMEEEGFYCLGLDDKKQQIKSIASNPGHLLSVEIVPGDRARKVVERLFQRDMWCGWGIRTLSWLNPAYNPISYQLGSVWPHDNSIIASGMKQYGFYQEANRVAEGLFAAADFFQGSQMPELFAGIERSPRNFPVPYPDACVPQAWAAGSIFLLIRMMLGLQADAPSKRLMVHPTLPEWLPDLSLTNMCVGDTRVSLRFWRDQQSTKWEAFDIKGELHVNELNGH